MLSFKYNMTVKISAEKSTTTNTPDSFHLSSIKFASTYPSTGSFNLTPRGEHSTTGNTIEAEISAILGSAKTDAFSRVHRQGIDPSLAIVSGELVGASYKLGPIMPGLENLPPEITDGFREKTQLSPFVTMRI